MSDPVLTHIQANRSRSLDRLKAYIRCPSVSTDPAYRDGMEQARRLVETWLDAAGFANRRRLDSGGHAAIYADWVEAPGKPTLLLYGHYDVQPPDPAALWQSPPFEPEERDGRLYGRGVSDDKAPVVIALEVLAAFLAVEGGLPVNIKLLIEGEEEMGSPTLPAIFQKHRALLSADAVLSADGARWRPDLVSINVGSRGSGGMEFQVRTAVKDLHSGRYGGVVPNALHVLAGIVASLHDENGRIAIDGFYDGVKEPSEAERSNIATFALDENEFYANLEAVPAGEAGYGLLERLWLRPSLDVNGIWGGYTGAGGKTVIAHKGWAKITTRLVCGQDPAHIRAATIAHLQKVCPPGVRLDITDERGWTGAYTVPEAHPLLLAAEQALETTTGTRPRRVRIGATLPLTEIVNRVLGIDTVMFSFSTADEDFHAPNECFRLTSIDEGFAAWTEILRVLGKQKAGDYAAYTSGIGFIDTPTGVPP